MRDTHRNCMSSRHGLLVREIRPLRTVAQGLANLIDRLLGYQIHTIFRHITEVLRQDMLNVAEDIRLRRHQGFKVPIIAGSLLRNSVSNRKSARETC